MGKSGISKNNARLNMDIKRELIDITSNMKDPSLQTGIVTITRVEAAKDLSTCRVMVSVLGSEHSPEAVVNALNKAKGHVRSEIASRMNIRRSPEFLFEVDGSAEYADNINKLLKGL